MNRDTERGGPATNGYRPSVEKATKPTTDNSIVGRADAEVLQAFVVASVESQLRDTGDQGDAEVLRWLRGAA